MPGKVYRTAIYCRLSREDGDKVESNSIASQRAICEDYIARHDDLEIVCEPFVDDGYSGVSFNRPNFKKLEDAIRKGAIDCIVVKDLSRFSRNYIDGGRYLEKIFPQLGIRFIAVNDAYDSLTGDPQSDSFVIPFKNLINDSYCKDISMKIRSSLEVKQKNGEFVGAFAPYGYKKSPDNKNQLIVDEAVSEYVQMIFAMYKDGFSIGRIAARLNQMGVLSPMEYKHSAGVKFDTVFKTGDTAKWITRLSSASSPMRYISVSLPKANAVRQTTRCALCSRRMKPSGLRSRGRTKRLFPMRISWPSRP